MLFHSMSDQRRSPIAYRTFELANPQDNCFSAIIFWDAKRPITVAVLRRLDLLAVARELNLERSLEKYLQLSAESRIDLAQLSVESVQLERFHFSTRNTCLENPFLDD